MKRLILIFCIILFATPAQAKRLHHEKHYQTQWCRDNGGETEVVLPDRTRCDCLTDKHAIEFDFGNKWAESVGQVLYYSIQTGKKAGIVLTDKHAIEFDFGNKWAESIGQALYYSIQTGKKAGIVLILEKKKDYRYWIRLNTIIEHYGLPIDTWIVMP